MIASNDWREQERQDALSRLETVVKRRMRPEEWRKQFVAQVLGAVEPWRQVKDEGGPEGIKALVDVYHVTRRIATPAIPTEYFFWVLSARVHMEAHVGPEAMLYQKDYLGPLWDRRPAIRQKYGWPEEDESGEPWSPADHPEQLPRDYVAWSAEFDAVADDMEKAALRAVCEQYGVPEIVELEEQDPGEYGRRCEVGRSCFSDEDSPDEPSPGTTQVPP